MKIFTLFFIVIFVFAYSGTSCTQPTTNQSSESGDDDHDDEDNTHTRTCSDRDSCQDICDDLFSYTTERSECYELSYEDVNTISKVADEFYHKNVSPEELEDLDADDVRAYLEIGMESFIDLIKGEAVGDDAKDDDDPQWEKTERPSLNRQNSLDVLEWIAKTEDIAEVILEQDSDFEIGLELFTSLGDPADGQALDTLDTNDPTVNHGANFWGGDGVRVHSGSALACVVFSMDDVLKIGELNSDSCVTPRTPSKLVDLGNSDKPDLFLDGFLDHKARFSDDSFITFAADERNETAFEWGHKTLLEFCKEATDEDESDVEVKTCLQTVYCLHRSVEAGENLSDSYEGIFEDLKDYDDIVGRTDEEYCEDLVDEDRIEDLFD